MKRKCFVYNGTLEQFNSTVESLQSEQTDELMVKILGCSSIGK